ncbi:hypothetical protein VNO77_03980 [Canavalia gladiata]|uniref:Uncharacterized protein n=1 Tax=Canavalia gladiata TaxID=3824 RepID=A0AAN9MVN5_CANGL
MLGSRRDKKLVFGGLELNFTESKNERSDPLILTHQQSSITDSITVASACVNDILRDSSSKMSSPIIRKRPLSSLSNVLPKDNKKVNMGNKVEGKYSVVVQDSSPTVEISYFNESSQVRQQSSVAPISPKIMNPLLSLSPFGPKFSEKIKTTGGMILLIWGFPAVLSIPREKLSPKIKEVPNRFEGSYSLEVVRGSEAIRKTRAEAANGVTDHRRPSKESMQGHEIMQRRPCNSQAKTACRGFQWIKQRGFPTH